MHVISLIHQIAYFSQMYCPSVIKVKKSRNLGPGPTLVYPCGFFDGASAKNVGGVGFCLFLNESHSFEFALGVGSCTNTKEKLIRLLGTPTYSPNDGNTYAQDIWRLFSHYKLGIGYSLPFTS